MNGFNGHDVDCGCDFVSIGSGDFIGGNVWDFPQGGICF